MTTLRNDPISRPSTPASGSSTATDAPPLRSTRLVAVWRRVTAPPDQRIRLVAVGHAQGQRGLDGLHDRATVDAVVDVDGSAVGVETTDHITGAVVLDAQ